MRNVIGAPPQHEGCATSKRGFTGKSVVDDNKKLPSLAAAHRPITKRFVATLKLQYGSQNLICTNAELDVDDYNSADNLPFFMFEEQAVGCGHEVDMEDIAVEHSVTDIDDCDGRNPLAVVEYLDDIYVFYREKEASGCAPPNYMCNQFDINEKMRAILIDWLIEVHYKFELMDETLFLTVNIIDRYLACQSVGRKKLQLVGVTAMLLACKYEEVSVPVVEDLILISDRAYTREEVLVMEKLMVNTLEFNISVPTQYVFMRRFLKAAQSEKQLELLSFFLIELALVEYEMLKFRPSLLAAAAVYTAQSAISGLRHWNKTNEVYTNYTEEQLQECSRQMVKFHQDAATGKLTGVYRKYSAFKFGFTVHFEPALFLLDRRE